MNKEKGIKKDCLFSITKMNKFYFFPFLVPVVCYSTKFFSEVMKFGNEDPEGVKKKGVNEDVEHSFVFLYTMINGVSHIMGGLLYFISLLRTKSEKLKTKNDTEDDDDYKIMKEGAFAGIKNNTYDSIDLYHKIDKYKFLKVGGILFIMSFILTSYIIIKGYAAGHQQLEKRLYFLFFFTLFKVFIFKQEVYFHQKLSLGIAGFGMIILFSIYFIFLKYESYNYIYDVLLFSGSFFYSLYLMLIKILTVNNGMSPFLVLLFIGIFSTFSTLFGYVIFSFVNKGDLTYVSNLFHCSNINYICFGVFYRNIICYFLINSVLQVLILLVIYYFSPEIFAISDIISPLFSFIEKCVLKKEDNPIVITFNIIGYLIVLLGAFIYNELIVCNFWELNRNTWKWIDKRADDEIGERNNSYDSNSIDGNDVCFDRDFSMEMANSVKN